MKPTGFYKMLKEVNSSDKFPHKSVKKWKRGEKQKMEKEIKKETLATIDIAIKNLENGEVGEVINLEESAFSKALTDLINSEGWED